MCRKLLSQPYIGPIYAMLLYQWLLANKEAGWAEQRQKHINLLTAGAILSVHAPFASVGLAGEFDVTNCTEGQKYDQNP